MFWIHSCEASKSATEATVSSDTTALVQIDALILWLAINLVLVANKGCPNPRPQRLGT
jgi:hypothetical protein